MSQPRRRQKAIQSLIEESNLSKIKNVLNYLFFDQYQDMASFPRFEECLSFLTKDKGINFQEAFTDVIGEKHKYLTFRRMIRAFFRIQEGGRKVKDSTKKLFEILFNGALKGDGDFIGEKKEGATKFHSQNSEGHKAISTFSVITDESKEKIKGMQIVYDDFFINDLYPKSEKDNYVGLEVNLKSEKDIPDELKDKFPDKNMRDGIISIVGTFTDHLTAIGFKCRSGKTVFVGKPEGDSFLFSEVGKELKYVILEILNGEINYFEPHFEEIDRSNPHIDKTTDEITDDFLKEDKPIFEEEKLKDMTDEEIQKNMLQPLIPDDAFFNKENDDVIKGNDISDMVPLTKRYWDKEPEKDKINVKIDEKTILKEADDCLKNQQQRKNLTEHFGGLRESEKPEVYVSDQVVFDGKNITKNNTPGSIILDTLNYDTLLTNLGDKIAIDFKNGLFEIEKKNPPPHQKTTKLKAGGFGFNFFDFNDMENHFNDVRKNLFSFFEDDDSDWAFQQEMKRRQLIEEERQKKLNEEIKRQKMQNAQNNWKKLSSKLSKNQGLYLIQTIGGVIKGLKVLEAENSGKPTNYTMQEKVALFELLKNNRPIIAMLAKAHQEALRRKLEEQNNANNKKEDDKKRREELNRKMEEKKKAEEEKKRIENEKKIEDEKKKIAEEQKKREEEEKKRQLEIQAEKDKKKKEELEKKEAEKKKEEEKKKAQEEARKKELEKQKKLLEDQKKRAEEIARKKEEQKKKEEEARRKKEEEERKKKEEVQKRQEEAGKGSKELKISQLAEINKKLELIQKMYPSATGEKKQMLYQYYQELIKDRNAIIQALNDEQKDKVAEKMDFDAEEAKKKEEEERKKLKEEEDKKIIEKQKEEEAKKEAMTQVVSVNNSDLPRNIKTYRHQKMPPKGQIWTDDLFQPVRKNLCPVDSYGRWSFPEGIDANDVQGWDRIKWARAEQIFNSKNYQVFYQGVEADDIIQGGLGDCYFLSAVAALCKYPKLVEKLFYVKQKSEEHCYGCYYRINGIWQLVLIDDYIPCYGNYGLNFAFTSTHGNELWVILLEKAWAKLNGNYAKAIGGEPHEVFDVITDAWSEKLVVRSDNTEEIWNKLLDAEKKGYLMTAGTSGDTYHLPIEQVGLVPGHAYTILGVKELNTGKGKVRLVHIRNPWGNTEWSGDWSDKSSKWTNELRQQVGVQNKNDGSFWMAYDDFLKFYLVAGICHLHEDYVYSNLHYPKAIANKGPLMTKVDVMNNGTHLYLQLHQKNPRIALKDGTYQKPVINYLMLVDKDNNYIKAANNCYMNNCIEVNVNKGTYYLITDINFRYVQTKMHCYNLTTYSNYPVKISQEKSRNLKHTFKCGLLDYARKNLQPQSHAGGIIYQSKRQNNEFPFNFLVYDNTSGPYDVTFKDTLQMATSNRCAEFYLEDGKEKSNPLEKTVVSGDFDVICHMPYDLNARYSYQLQCSAKQGSGARPVNNVGNVPKGSPSSNPVPESTNNSSPQSQDEIAKSVFSERPENLDNRGLLKQYVHQVPGGYYIGLENGSNQNLNLKLCLTGLYESNNPNLSEVPFTIQAMTRRMFLVKPKPGYKGGISFVFDYA